MQYYYFTLEGKVDDESSQERSSAPSATLRAAANLKENTGPSVFTRAREQGEPLILGMADGSQRKARVTSEADYDVELDDGLHRKIEILYAIPTTSAKNLKKVLKRDPKVEALDLRPAEKAKDRPWISKMILQQIIDEGSRARFTLTDGAMIPVRVRSFGLYEINGDIKGKSITIFDMACTVSMLAGRSWLVLIRGSYLRFQGRGSATGGLARARWKNRSGPPIVMQISATLNTGQWWRWMKSDHVASRQAVGDVAKSTGDDEGEGTVDEPPGFPLAIPHEQEEEITRALAPMMSGCLTSSGTHRNAEAYISVLGAVEVEHTRYDGPAARHGAPLGPRVSWRDHSRRVHDQEQENDEGSQFHGGLSQREIPWVASLFRSQREHRRGLDGWFGFESAKIALWAHRSGYDSTSTMSSGASVPDGDEGVSSWSSVPVVTLDGSAIDLPHHVGMSRPHDLARGAPGSVRERRLEASVTRARGG